MLQVFWFSDQNLEDGKLLITCQDDISFEKGLYRTYIANEVCDLEDDHILVQPFCLVLSSTYHRDRNCKKGLSTYIASQ